MSMAHTKESLEKLLSDSDIKVMALSGKWGTGKSHMWDSLRNASDVGGIKTACYISLFGVSSITDLKLKLAQTAVPLLAQKGPRGDALNAALKAAKDLSASFFKGIATIDTIALLSVPAFMRDKFIVIDDIERKHTNLSIDEILGFIDDFTQNYGCRILLILNTDQLNDKGVWEKFREKVIDEELRLDTTPSEACDIATKLTPSECSAEIKSAVEACGLTNIRVIRKVIRAVNRIIVDRTQLSNAVLKRVIPSTVLLAAIHYKGIENGPSMAFVLGFDVGYHTRVAISNKWPHGEENTEDRELHTKWARLLERLGIVCIDEYEKLLCDYLKSGLLDQSNIDAIIDRYRVEEQNIEAQSRAQSFFQRMRWHPDLTQQQLLDEAKPLLADVPYLNCYTVSALHDFLMDLDNGKQLAAQIRDSFIATLHHKAAEPGADPQKFILDNWANQPLHPEIKSAYKDIHAKLGNKRTLLDVCLHLAQSDGWGASDEATMQSATVDDFKKTIFSLHGEQLKMFILKNIDIYANRGTSEKHFGSAPTYFLEACRMIQTERAGTRWPSFIESLLKNV